MEQYIDKCALVVEIDRLENKLYYEPEKFKDVGAKMALDSLKSFIDTLEVKEMDLDKEIDRVWDDTSDKFFEGCWEEFENIAKHFFELGLKVQKGEEV